MGYIKVDFINEESANQFKTIIWRTIQNNVNDASKDASNKKRLSRNELYNEIVEICLDYKSLERISKEINKSLNYLKDRIIPEMLELGLLERKYPEAPRHPKQQYRKK